MKIVKQIGEGMLVGAVMFSAVILYAFDVIGG